MMKAIKVIGDKLSWEDCEDYTELPADHVEIDVVWTAINRADLMQRAGVYPPPPGASDIMGLEVSGRVAALGESVSGLEVGQEVCALLTGGGYATKVVVPAVQVLPVPKGYSLDQAAAIPEVFATAWLNLYQEAELQPGERLLLHAGASGLVRPLSSWQQRLATRCLRPRAMQQSWKFVSSWARQVSGIATTVLCGGG